MLKRISVWLIVILFNHSVIGQDTKFQPLFTAINVSNIDTSINWYSRVFGLKLRNRVDNAERGFKQAILIDKGIMIELVELRQSISPDSLLKMKSSGTKLLGITKFGVGVSGIDNVYNHLINLGVSFHGKMVSDPVSDKKNIFN